MGILLTQGWSQLQRLPVGFKSRGADGQVCAGSGDSSKRGLPCTSTTVVQLILISLPAHPSKRATINVCVVVITDGDTLWGTGCRDCMIMICLPNVHMQVYRHIILAVCDTATGLYGALGISRCRQLMDKPLQYSSLAALVQDYHEAYRC